jgi:transcriptional regulator with XRE-family HTH domain
MANARVNVDALYAALDREREVRHVSWRELAKEAGISPSTLSRMRNGETRPSVDAFAALTAWLGASQDDFVEHDGPPKQDQDLVAQLAPLLRARKDLAADDVEYLEDVIAAAVKRLRYERSRS